MKKMIKIFLLISTIVLCLSSCVYEEVPSIENPKNQIEPPSQEELLEEENKNDVIDTEKETVPVEKPTNPEITKEDFIKDFVEDLNLPQENIDKIKEDFKNRLTPPTKIEILNSILSKKGFQYDGDTDTYTSWWSAYDRHEIKDKVDGIPIKSVVRDQNTINIDFEYNGLSWRIQPWKGQYGVLSGAEVEVFNKNKKGAYYRTSEDLEAMSICFNLYKNKNEMKKNKLLCSAIKTDEWMFNKFKKDQITSYASVMELTISSKDALLINAIEQGLLSGESTKEFSLNNSTDNFYYRNENSITIFWQNAGEYPYEINIK